MSETAVVIDYGSGNLRSAAKALERAAEESGKSTQIIVTDSPDVVAGADRIILPGVGAFADCRAGLLAIDGLKDAIQTAVREKGKPFLGICVGMQLMAIEGHEFGTHKGMGWIDGTIEALEPSDKSLKIPHMGWNELELSENGSAHPVTKVLTPGDHAYFVHSYHMELQDAGSLLATTDYGGTVTAVVGKDNMIGTQFHPEKSQNVGLKFLKAFLEWQP